MDCDDSEHKKCSTVTKVHQPPTWRSQGKISSRKRPFSEGEALPQAVITGHMVPLSEWELHLNFSHCGLVVGIDTPHARCIWGREVPAHAWWSKQICSAKEREHLKQQLVRQEVCHGGTCQWCRDAQGFVFVGQVCLRGLGANVVCTSVLIQKHPELLSKAKKIDQYRSGAVVPPPPTSQGKPHNEQQRQQACAQPVHKLWTNLLGRCGQSLYTFYGIIYTVH